MPSGVERNLASVFTWWMKDACLQEGGRRVFFVTVVFDWKLMTCACERIQPAGSGTFSMCTLNREARRGIWSEISIGHGPRRANIAVRVRNCIINPKLDSRNDDGWRIRINSQTTHTFCKKKKNNNNKGAYFVCNTVSLFFSLFLPHSPLPPRGAVGHTQKKNTTRTRGFKLRGSLER